MAEDKLKSLSDLEEWLGVHFQVQNGENDSPTEELLPQALHPAILKYIELGHRFPQVGLFGERGRDGLYFDSAFALQEGPPYQLVFTLCCTLPTSPHGVSVSYEPGFGELTVKTGDWSMTYPPDEADGLLLNLALHFLLDTPDTVGCSQNQAQEMFSSSTVIYQDSAWIQSHDTQETFCWVKDKGLLARFQRTEHLSLFYVTLDVP